MVNVRCYACQAKYRVLSTKNYNLLDCNVSTTSLNNSGQQQSQTQLAKSNNKPNTPRFPYKPPKLRKPRSYNKVRMS